MQLRAHACYMQYLLFHHLSILFVSLMPLDMVFCCSLASDQSQDTLSIMQIYSSRYIVLDRKKCYHDGIIRYSPEVSYSKNIAE